MTAIVDPKLEVHEDLQFQRRWWALERVGWVAMLLIISGGLAGVFGTGPLSTVTRASASGQVQMEFDRVIRKQSPQKILLWIPQTEPDTSLPVRIPREYLDRIEVQQIHPQPGRATSDPDHMILEFAAPAEGAGLTIEIDFEAREACILEGTWHLGPESILVRHIVLP